MFLKPIGGLANRMRAIESCLMIAKQNQIPLVVLWEKNEGLNCPFEQVFTKPTEFELRELSSPLQKILYHSKPISEDKNPIIKLSKRLAIQYLKVVTGVECFVYHTELAQQMEPILEKDPHLSLTRFDEEMYVQSKSVVAQLSTASSYITNCYRISKLNSNYSMFNPLDSIKEQIQKTSSKFSNTIGLHIRRTDHVKSIQSSGLEKFEKVIEDHIEKDETTTFFLASDSGEVKKSLNEKFGSKILTADLELTRDSYEGIKGAVIDMYCLSRTKKIYGSYFSTYSQVAAAISDIEEVIV